MRTLYVGLLLVGLLGGAVALAQQNPDTATQELIARLNQNRLENGQNPLRVSAALTQLAQDQVNYLLTLDRLPTDANIHTGADGSSPQERARQAHWTPYGEEPEDTLIGALGGIGSVEEILALWLANEETSLNPAFREVGAAVAPQPGGYVAIVVFGGRPNVLPVLIDTANGQLFLSNDPFEGGSVARISRVERIQLFDADGQPLSDSWQLWRPRLPLPESATAGLFVLYTDGDHRVLTPVDPQRDVALLPAGFDPPAEPSPTPIPTNTPRAAATTIAPTEAAAAPTVNPEDADLLVVYDEQSLTLINVSAVRLDISRVVLSGSGVTLPTAKWSEAVPLRLSDFLQTGCLQVWSWDEPQILPQPAACGVRVAYATIRPSERFWTQGDFEVRLGNTLLATCAPDAGECGVGLD